MTKAFTNPSLKKLLTVPCKTRSGTKAMDNAATFIKKGGSVFDIVKMGPQGVGEAFALNSTDAQALLEKAESLCLHIAREYREQRLVRNWPTNPLHRTGVRAHADTPTFDELFKPDWEGASPVQSPDSSTSPAAYFIRLVILARDLEARAAGGPGLIPFETRRPDLTELIIDTISMFQIKPTVTLVNEVLESIIKESFKPSLEEKDQVVDDILLETRFPQTSMPFEWYFEQYRLVLDDKNLPLGEVVRAIDLSAPYFKQSGAIGEYSDIALHQSCNLGPQQQRMLTENFVEAVNSAAFYKDNFGSSAEALLNSVHLCNQVAIDAESLTSLLSVENFAPTLSSNVAHLSAPTPKDFGSVYINFGADGAMVLSDPGTDNTRQLQNSSLNRFDRMNRILRMSRWLKLRTDECDRLVMAVFHAELRGDIEDPAARQFESTDRLFKITNNTLRALGLFSEFRQLFKCTAEQFAALIDGISPYSRGEEPSQFDRIFNVKALFDEPLAQDDGYFSIAPQTRADRRTVDQICSSLRFTQETWDYLARYVANSFNLRDELRRDLLTLSAFYRLALLASFLRISPIELTALLETLSEQGASEVVQQILGETRLSVSGVNGTGDVLSVMHAVQTCVRWLQAHNLNVPWLVTHVARVTVPSMATEADVSLLQEIHGRMQPVLLNEDVFRAAGVPQGNDATGQGWLARLEELIDTDGLVSGLANDETDHDRAVAEIHAAVLEADLPKADEDRVRAVILALVLQARDAQSAVIQERLSVYLSLSQDLVLPLLKWVNRGGVYLLLRETARALGEVTSGADKVNVGDKVLNLLGHLEQRAEVIQKFSLSSAMLLALTDGQNWQRFGLKQAETLTLNTLYQLAIFQDVVTHTGQPAEKLLDYLELVNTLPPVLTVEDQQLIRDSASTRLAAVLNWSVREVLACVLHLDPSKPIVRDVTTLDALLRIRRLATLTGLDATAIIQLGALTPVSDKHAYRTAAEHVLESLSESTIEGVAPGVSEVGQSVTHKIRCINPDLIANVDGQVALIELTLRDLANQVLPNITVTWASDRRGLLENTSITDQEGRAVIRYRPETGPWMGEVRITGTYGLGQVVYAPTVRLDCDEFSLDFDLDRTEDPEETFLAGGKGFFAVYVRLVDRHNNPGVGRTVTFAGQGVEADPVRVITDEKGYARTRVISAEPVVNASLVVSYSTKDSPTIRNITFVDNPSIKVLEVVSVALVGEPLKLDCHVIGLSKQPAKGVEVVLTSSADSALSLQAITGEDGIATFSVPGVVAGPQTYTAKVAMDERQVEIDVAKTAVIHGEFAEYRHPVAGSTMLMWVAVREEAYNQARPIPACEIWWSVTPAGGTASTPVKIPTDALGRSTYPFKVDLAGHYAVTADRQSTPADKRTFDLDVVDQIDWTYTLTDTTTQTVVSRTADAEPLAFVRGHSYELVITLPEGIDLTTARGMLAWDGDFSAKGMGMLFAPATGAYVVIGDNSTLTWTIDCQDLRNGAFDLTFSCDALEQRLRLAGRLDAPPPTMTKPIDAQTVEPQPLLYGTGSPSAQIFAFEGRNGALLTRTSVNDDGTWSMRMAARLSAGPHVLSVKQRHIDTTEAWAPDVNVNVDDNFVETVKILSPVSGSTVRVGTWIEGVGMPGVEVRIVRGGVPTEIYAQGRVNAEGRWRVQFKPAFAAGTYSCNAAFYVGDVQKSAWMSGAYSVTFSGNS